MSIQPRLFQAKVLAKHLKPQPIPADHLKALQSWQSKIQSGELAKQSEVSLHAPFMQQIMVGVLGYEPFGQAERYTIAREYAISNTKSTGSVDLALGEFYGDKSQDRIHAVFEVKGAKTKDLDAIMPGRHKSPVQQAWEYARDAKNCQWVLVTNYLEIRLYAVGETSLVYERFDLANLTEPQEYARFTLCLHANNLLSGRTADLLKISQQADKDITAQLYDDYKHLRETLLATLIKDNPQHAPTDLINPAQKLLDRMLFIAFAEDRGLIPDDTIKRAYEHADPYNPRPIYANFKGLFNAIDKGNTQLNIPAYNGGLFAPDEFLDQLTVSDKLCEAFKNLAEYDFASEVSVTVLGHIFEQSIADLEDLSERIQSGETLNPTKTAKATAVSGKRKQHGVVYTPDNITAFIVEHTLGDHLKQRFDALFADYGQTKADGTIQWKKASQTELKFWYAWQDTLQTIKMVDPACGSGAFLVAAFDYLHAEYQRTNDKIAELTGQAGVFDLNKEILNNNLYGVDLNDESIEISKLSLWLKTAERGKPLTSLDSNLKAGNSLGLTQAAPGFEFCWHVAFSDILQNGGFDVVLGNPPYVRQERFSDLKPWLEQHYAVYHGVADLYAYFFELGLKLLKPNGTLGYISSATFFKTGSGQPLRHFLSHQAWLRKVVDFGDIQVFEGVTTYPAILIFQNVQPNADNPVQFLALKEQLPDDLNQAFEQQAGVMSVAQLRGESWQLEDSRLHQLRFKLTHDASGKPYPTLKQVYGSPLYGIKTGLNEAFVIDRATRERIIAQDPHSAALIKPFLEGKDLKKWHAQPRELYLIFTRRGTDIEAYPGIKAYLEQFKERLMPKPKDWPSNKTWPGRKAGPYQWYEIQDTVGYFEEFEKPKLCWGNLQNRASFALDEKGYFVNAPSPILVTEDYLFVAGILNAMVTWFSLVNNAIARNGGYIECKPIYINEVIIPPASDTQKTQISQLAQICQTLAEQRYAIEAGFARRLQQDLCPPDTEPKLNQKSQAWWSLDFKTLQSELKKSFKLKATEVLIPVAERNDWQSYFEQQQAQHQSLSQQLTQAEAQLNQAVYALFNLTADDIALIEQQVK
ncbi:MAG: N-6 DNA methylase [Thiomicrospira sp.]|jgi:type I restriction-modification system DNA methylase subunit|nr:N-6 DNA methylase [Thiomicrospira sp.]